MTLAIYQTDATNREPVKNNGEVFTDSSIVDFMLVLGNYEDVLIDSGAFILEPACGQGDFLVPIAHKLVELAQQKRVTYQAILKKVCAYEINENNVNIAIAKIAEVFQGLFGKARALDIAKAWVKHKDFLVEEIDKKFTLIIGNPPYVRIENIERKKLRSYRKLFRCMKERADIYVAFFEKTLRLLEDNGKHIFICSDRWMKNSYGRCLRGLISERYSLFAIIDLYHHAAFKTDVSAYPAITVIGSKNATQNRTLVLSPKKIDTKLAQEIAERIDYKDAVSDQFLYIRIDKDKPILFADYEKVELVHKMENSFDTIEAVGCRVRVGAATGNNTVFIVDNDKDIESDRLLPVVTASDITSDGLISWSRKFIINTFEKKRPIELDKYPKLKKYLEFHKEALMARHIAKKNPKYWYRTIDRVCEDKASEPKILIPDISSRFIAAIDKGRYFPNNSLYYITSESWPIVALQHILTAGIAQLFIEVYSTKVANGYFRFQAQHLRKIRLPYWRELNESIKERLVQEYIDEQEKMRIVQKIYCLSEDEMKIVQKVRN